MKCWLGLFHDYGKWVTLTLKSNDPECEDFPIFQDRTCSKCLHTQRRHISAGLLSFLFD